MSYQLRHREYGVFQGECFGMGFWHPMSEMPEQGYCEFPTYESVAAFRAFLCSPEEMRTVLRFPDLVIEPYDAHESERLRRVGSADLEDKRGGY